MCKSGELAIKISSRIISVYSSNSSATSEVIGKDGKKCNYRRRPQTLDFERIKKETHNAHGSS